MHSPFRSAIGIALSCSLCLCPAGETRAKSAHWGDITPKECVDPVNRKWSAILWDIDKTAANPSGSWEVECEQISHPAVINGTTYPKPHYCVNFFFMWGEWTVPDAECAIKRLEAKVSVLVKKTCDGVNCIETSCFNWDGSDYIGIVKYFCPFVAGPFCSSNCNRLSKRVMDVPNRNSSSVSCPVSVRHLCLVPGNPLCLA